MTQWGAERGRRHMPGTRSVLVVDDTPAFREMVGVVLTRRGYRVTSAANGREALERLSMALEPQVVLLDLVMPVLDGAGVLRAIEADPSLAAAGHRIVIMSSTPRHVASYVPPEYPWLAKPFTPAQLLAAVEAVWAE